MNFYINKFIAFIGFAFLLSLYIDTERTTCNSIGRTEELLVYEEEFNHSMLRFLSIITIINFIVIINF